MTFKEFKKWVKVTYPLLQPIYTTIEFDEQIAASVTRIWITNLDEITHGPVLPPEEYGKARDAIDEKIKEVTDINLTRDKSL